VSSYWIDTDCLIWAKNNPYPIDSRVGEVFWCMVNNAFEQGILKMNRRVFKEIMAGRDPKDSLRKWLSSREDLCISTSKEATQFATKIGDYLFSRTDHYDARHLVEFSRGADAWVIACAGADNGVAVSRERPQPQTRKPKVSDICKIFGVKCIDLHRLVHCLENNISPEHCTDEYRH
jgi:hypothetical protein